MLMDMTFISQGKREVCRHPNNAVRYMLEIVAFISRASLTTRITFPEVRNRKGAESGIPLIAQIPAVTAIWSLADVTHFTDSACI